MPGAGAERLGAAFPRWARRLGGDHLLDLSLLGQLADTALTSERAIEMNAGGLPNTFVPGRNLLFFTFAAIVADRRKLGADRRHVRDRLRATRTAATTR